MRRGLAHRRAFFLMCIAGAYGSADVQFGKAHARQLFGDAGQRILQVDLDVIGQRLERRHVDHKRLVWQLAAMLQALMHQIVEYRKEGGQGFAGAGGRGDQGRTPRLDQRPRLRLRGRHRRECAVKPGTDGGVERAQNRVRKAEKSYQ